MDSKHYWAIAERDIEIQNPITDRKLRLLDDYCDVRDGLRVLDVGCGKAWVMRQWAERFSIEGTGLDHNGQFLDFARARRPSRGKLTFVEGEARSYAPEPGSFDIVMCIGACFAIGEFAQAVDYLTAAARPGGAVVIGEMTLKHEPPFRSVNEILPLTAVDAMGVIERHGAEVSALISGSDADFERYVSHHRHATLRWAREHKGHPYQAEVLERSRRDWMHYLKIIRPYLGFSIFVGRRTGA